MLTDVWINVTVKLNKRNINIMRQPENYKNEDYSLELEIKHTHTKEFLLDDSLNEYVVNVTKNNSFSKSSFL